MSEPEIGDYARLVLINALKVNGWPEGYHRRTDYIEHIRSEVLPQLLNYDPRLSQLSLDSLIHNLFDEMRSADAFSPIVDRFAGEYFSVSPTHLKQFKQSVLNSSQIFLTASNIGVQRFFSDVFAGFRQDPEVDRSNLDHIPPPPIDDRQVEVNPAQLRVLKAPIDDLICQIEADNGLPDFPHFRERVLGQVKAGREMLLSGCIRVQLLYWVLLKALGDLVEKYGQKAIGVAAARLIELLVEQLFKK